MHGKILFLATIALATLTVNTSAQSYTVAETASPGVVRGRVSLRGDAPAPLKLLITKDAEICGEGYRERVEVDTDESGGLRNVVVYVEEIAEGKAWEDLKSGTAVNQITCRFQPHIQVIRRKSEIEIINSDSTLHNIHAYELIGRARRSMFNISQPEMGPLPQIMSPRSGHQVSLECDSHDFMQGWIFVTDHPYAVVVDASGEFELAGIPAGDYRLSTWHPRLGALTEEITVTKDSNDDVNFEYVLE